MRLSEARSEVEVRLSKRFSEAGCQIPSESFSLAYLRGVDGGVVGGGVSGCVEVYTDMCQEVWTVV